MPISEVKCCDCMDFMAKFPDKFFDLAIVDPPYFEGAGDPAYYRSRTCQSKAKPITETWNIPGQEYFTELFRVSRKQIIWGCNYYAQYIPCVSRIVWDKVNDGTPFSQAEIASWSDGVKVYMYRYKWNGMIQQDMMNKEFRFHPTQKPVALYSWLLNQFAKPGDKILDTHMGSQSSRIAAWKMGFDYWGCEIDQEYFDQGCARFEKERRQLSLFAQPDEPEQEALF